MKKLLLSTAAVALVAAATPAIAQDGGLELGISGHFKGYGVYTDQDEIANQSLREFDFRKETEVHFTGETTLDNGLTVGAHVELDLDRASNGANTEVEESYAFFSGDWGRINLGEEDGAAYLLQVAAPSADSNIDGIRQFINTFNYTQMGVAGSAIVADYDQAMTGWANKLTYITPVFSGFQAGISYTPSVTDADLNGLAAAVRDDTDGDLEDALEVAVRWEGSMDVIDFAFGAGYGDASVENDAVAAPNRDDRTQWNVGGNMAWGPFGFGVAYFEDDNGNTNSTNADTDALVVGADYTHGSFKFGLSYYDREDEANAGTHGEGADVELTRWTGGVVYEYGPGMTFRGSVSHVDVETATVGDNEGDGFQVTLGTQVNF